MIVTLWRVLLGSIATRVRVAALGLLGLVAVGLGLLVHLSNSANRPDASWSLVDAYGLSLLIPVVALMFASAALGDLAEDGTLVYLWLRPVPRWKLAVAAFGATMTASVLIAVVPLVIAAAITGGGARVVAAAASGSLLATVSYSAVFCGLGLRVRRAVAWGLAYLLIWEGAVARVSHGAARVSLSVAARSLAAHVGNHGAPRNAVSWPTAVIFSLVVAALALVVTTRSLDHGEFA
jgi:ABC-2 type transport system permease protein